MVGSTEEVKIGNKMAKARQYPWGVVQGMCTLGGKGSPHVSPVVTVPASSLSALFGEVLGEVLNDRTREGCTHGREQDPVTR